MARTVTTRSFTTPRLLPCAYADALGIAARQHRPAPGWPGYVIMAAREILLEFPIRGTGWMVAARLLAQAGSVVVGELRLFPNETTPDRPRGQWSAWALGSDATCPPSGVTARLVRHVPLGYVLKTARRYFLQLARTDQQAEVVSRRRQRREVQDHALAVLAQRYVEILAGGSRYVVKDLAQAMGVPGAKHEARIRDLIFMARQRSILGGPRKQGKAGGALTSHGKQLLAVVEQLDREHSKERGESLTQKPTRRGPRTRSSPTQRRR